MRRSGLIPVVVIGYMIVGWFLVRKSQQPEHHAEISLTIEPIALIIDSR